MNINMEPRPHINADAFVLEQKEDFSAEALQRFTSLLNPNENYITTQVEADNSVALCLLNVHLFDKLTFQGEAYILERFRIELVKVLNDMGLETLDQMYNFAGVKTFLFRPADIAKQHLNKWALTVAKTYLDMTNLNRWDGKLENPENFDSQIYTFPINTETDLVLSFAFSKEENIWYTLCELKSKTSENVFAQSSTHTADCPDLAKVICHLITLCDIAADFTVLEKAQATGWVKTDDNQYVRLIKPGEYELAGVIELPEDFAVCHGHVHLNDYTEETQHMILSPYGYGDFNDMVSKYGEAYAGQLFAKCAFEYEFAAFIEDDGPGLYKTFEEAMARVKETIEKTGGRNEMNKQHQFILPIGDWSDDGHGKCEKFLVSSNMPIEQVREAHYRIKEVTGINIEEICSEYQDDIFPAEAAKILCDLGYVFPDGEHEDNTKIFADDMVRIWIFLLQKACPDLTLQVTPEPELLPFYGFDSKGRHIGNIGYGLFD